MTKFVFVTGGTISGLGKGTILSSLGVVLQLRNVIVTALKIDPYLNVDAGLLSPYEHGEVFVLEDGTECDLDLGNYERCLNRSMTHVNSLTTGKLMTSIIQEERQGTYLGQTIQLVPHVTNAIQDWFERVSIVLPSEQEETVVLVEVGGTVGDMESAVYLEAIQRFQQELGPNNSCVVHVGYLPIIGEEQKTKPCQHSVKFLREAGIRPDFILCRSDREVGVEEKRKVAVFCQVLPERVISMPNRSNLYQVPFALLDQRMDVELLKVLGMRARGRNLELEMAWKGLAFPPDTQSHGVIRIAIVGKYVELTDAYRSIVQALHHASYFLQRTLHIEWIDSESVEEERLEKVDGVLVPGGFGSRGIEGKIRAAAYCYHHSLPYLGICLGFQVAVVALAREVLGWTDATSEEWSLEGKQVIRQLSEGKEQRRLGLQTTNLLPDTQAAAIYGNKQEIQERHRHRYEVNRELLPELETIPGLVFSGTAMDGNLMEIMELSNHRFFLGTQFHPEFSSRPLSPHPLFVAFLEEASSTCR
jgi:CTP synthase